MGKRRDGENYLYPMDGRDIKLTEGSSRTVADPDWQIMAGDYEGYGRTEILCPNTWSGEIYLYSMDGRIVKPSDLRSVPIANWTVVGNEVLLHSLDAH